MNNDTINVNYPAIYSGTDKSEIVFIDGTPDLNSIFTPGESTQRRFFVTDATIASLDCMQSFISKLYPKLRILSMGYFKFPKEFFRFFRDFLGVFTETAQCNDLHALHCVCTGGIINL